MTLHDRRITPARADLAAEHLRGQVDAARFVEGETARVIVGVAPVRSAPRPDAGLDTEALFGEAVTVYEEDAEGWAWVQLERDGYVGYMPSHALLKGPVPAATHRVSALRTFLFPGASIKEPPLDWLSLGATVTVLREAVAPNGRRFAVTHRGAIVAQHLAPVASIEPDPVAIAERFLGAPYLWGGRSSLGLDCSGLVQTALGACGIPAPRDSDQQEASVGEPLPLDPASWRRGDLLFWAGHVAFVRDGASMLHANAHQMMVGIEPLAEGLARIEASGSPLRTVRRP